MEQREAIEILDVEEQILRRRWYKVFNLLEDDMYAIWSEEIKKGFHELKDETEKIAYIIRKLHSHYRGEDGDYKEHIGHIREFLQHINKKIKQKDKWVKFIAQDIEQIIEDVEEEKRDFTDQSKGIGRKALMLRHRREFNILEEVGFPVKRYFDLALFLVRHWDDVGRLIPYGRDNSLLFRRGLPAVRDLINEQTWPDFERLCYKTSPGFVYSFPVLRPLLPTRGLHQIVDDILELKGSVDIDGSEFFTYGLPSVKHIIAENPWT